MPSSYYANKHLSTGNKFVVVGLGPAGLATSLLLEKLGKDVIVYEKAVSWEKLLHSDKYSYPIGINERTLACFDEIDVTLRKELEKNSILIENWVVRDVFKYKSSTCYSSTRSYVVSLLYHHIMSRAEMSSIHIHFNCEVTDIDILQRRIYIKQWNGTSDFHRYKTIDFSDAKVIASDGTNSIIREACSDPTGKFAYLEVEAKESESATKAIVSSTSPCNKIFRVVYASGHANELFDKEFEACNHYIYDGLYIACVIAEGKHQWIMALAIDLSVDPSSFLLADRSSPKALSQLRSFLFRTCPLLKYVFLQPPQWEADELAPYFGSRTYRVNIVMTDRLNFGEAVLLVGDAAHAVIPPVGEGFNSAMEDALVLFGQAQKHQRAAVCEGPQQCQEDILFAEYNEKRIRDIQALSRIALMDNANLTQPERSARILLRMLQAALRKTGLVRHTGEDYLYGPESRKRLPYEEIEEIMNFQQRCLMPAVRLVAYPLYYAFVLMSRIAAAVLGTGVADK